MYGLPDNGFIIRHAALIADACKILKGQAIDVDSAQPGLYSLYLCSGKIIALLDRSGRELIEN